MQGPNTELVVGHSRELVMIAYEGASYYVDSRLLKIGDRGSPVDIPQHKVIDGQKVIGRTVDRRHLFLVCRDSEREDQSGLLGERPQDLSRLLARFNYLPTLRAQIALNRGNPSQALEVLEVSAPYELV